MSRALLPLWRFADQMVMPVGALLLLTALTYPRVDLWPAALVWSCLALVGWGVFHRRWVWLAMRARTFNVRYSARMVLYSDPALQSADVATVEELFQNALDEQAIMFGFHLRRKPLVFLFSSDAPISRTISPQFAGYALCPANVILVAADAPLGEHAPHEVCHLYAARLNRQASVFVVEGLCTWLQTTIQGVAVDEAARQVPNPPPLTSLLGTKEFFAATQLWMHYVLAGSFTGWLIHRFGWTAYRRFFRAAKGGFAKRAFRQHFAMSFEEADAIWRKQVL